MTWLTSWTQCWTEACSFLPLLTSGFSTGAPCDGGRVDPALSGACRSLQVPPSPHFALWLRTKLPSLPTPGSVTHMPARPWASFCGGQAFPTRLAAGEKLRGAAQAVLEATEKPLLPCTELRTLHKGPFSFPTALLSPAFYYLSPAKNVSQERPPQAAATELAIH